MTADKQVVDISWRAAAEAPGWHPDDDVETVDVTLRRSIGFLLSEDQGQVVIAQSLDWMGYAQGWLAIPRSAINSIHLTSGEEYVSGD